MLKAKFYITLGLLTLSCHTIITVAQKQVSQSHTHVKHKDSLMLILSDLAKREKQFNKMKKLIENKNISDSEKKKYKRNLAQIWRNYNRAYNSNNTD